MNCRTMLSLPTQDIFQIILNNLLFCRFQPRDDRFYSATKIYIYAIHSRLKFSNNTTRTLDWLSFAIFHLSIK